MAIEEQKIIIETLERQLYDFFLNKRQNCISNINELLKIFHPSCFNFTECMKTNDFIIRKLMEFSKEFILGEFNDFETFKLRVKSYDFSVACNMVWRANYFAFRCRTCRLSSNMALCTPCFIKGNHVGHDFYKFKSKAGGACDCGNSDVMKEFGFCCNHGPNRLNPLEEVPESLIYRFKLLMPIYLKSFLSSSLSLLMTDEDAINSSTTVMSALSLINEFLTCGSVTQEIIAAIMIDESHYNSFMNDWKSIDTDNFYQNMISLEPDFVLPVHKIGSQQLTHRCLLDAYIFICLKLQFPENLVVFLIGLLTIDSYRKVFVDSYLDHYSRIVTSLMTHAQSLSSITDSSNTMDSKISHISVQLFSSEPLALKMVKGRNVHYLIVHCLQNLLNTSLTRLDTKDNRVIDCDSSVIKNRVTCPFVSDLKNILTHKSVTDYVLTDMEFMNDWTQLLKYMQFMNLIGLKEHDHVEYDSMVAFHAFCLEIDLSTSIMWNIWYHYRSQDSKRTLVKFAHFFTKSLSECIDNLGVFKLELVHDSSRKPLSFHLPFMRNVACFLSLLLFHHNINLSEFMEDIGLQQMIKWFKVTSNILLGSQEILIGYWVRNGDDVNSSRFYYVNHSFCYGMIDMDILASQICASVIPSSAVIYILTDPTQLLKGIEFTIETKSDTETVKVKNKINPLLTDIRSLALEAWLMNLCWLLDLRNEMDIDDRSKLRKEVCCQLCLGPIKRSDLNERIAKKTGINILNTTEVDSILNEVADYTPPKFDEHSGSLHNGTYAFKRELWDVDYDPVFQSLRSISKQSASKALIKYREHYKQKENVQLHNSLWPPYRIPPPPHYQLSKLDNILHFRDLTYILGSCLSMFLNCSPLVTEDSLALVVHLIHRALTIEEPRDNLTQLTEFPEARFPDNPFKIDNMWINVRRNVETGLKYINNGTEEIVHQESILSMLLKIHSKLHTLRKQNGGKSLSSGGDFDVMSLDFFDDYPLVYAYSQDNLRRASDIGLGVKWGDGVDFIGHLLDLIASKKDDNSKYLLELIDSINQRNAMKYENIRPQYQDERDIEKGDNFSERKQKVNDRRQRVLSNMISKQKAFAVNNKVDMLDGVLVNEEGTGTYECAICQLKDDNLQASNMLLLGTTSGSDVLMYMNNRCGSHKGSSEVVYRKDVVARVNFSVPLTSNGRIIQTCGHTVHKHCFDLYKTQKIGNTRNQSSISCPLCRRMIHFMLPINTEDILVTSEDSFYSNLECRLLKSHVTPPCDIKTNFFGTSYVNRKIANIDNEHQACSLLRSQLELELIVCLSAPDQYSTVTKRCHWPQFISYLRTLNANISTLIRQSDWLLGTSIYDKIKKDDEENRSSQRRPFLLEVPSDVLLNFIPYVWPYKDQVRYILDACIIMAYIKGMVMVASKLNRSQYDHWSTNISQTNNFQGQFSSVLMLCKEIVNIDGESRDNCAITVNDISTDIVRYIIPLLRIAAVLQVHMLDGNDLPEDFPISMNDDDDNLDVIAHFYRLCNFLNLPPRNSVIEPCSDYLLNMISTCLSSTLHKDFDQLTRQYISDDFLTFVGASHRTNSAILNLGNEIYSPRLMTLPNYYEDLFNTNHNRLCDSCTRSSLHNVPVNGLCLICGQLLCFVCKQMPPLFLEHTRTCCLGTGLIIDINSSIIYVLVDHEATRWGSVYLDEYGEEDLELKRGRPLLLNVPRLRLLQQQWLTLSFKHILKSWQIISLQ